jgi:hypothetical protein
VEGSSRRHAQICTQYEGPADIGPGADDDHQAGTLGPAPDRREDAPAVDGLEPEIDEDGVEGLPPEQGEGRITVGGDDRLGVFHIGSVLDCEHARDHRAPPP